MNDIREIVTKAVIGKGKKRFKITSPLNDLRSPADSILGCWIINHKFGARKCDNSVAVKGVYDINVWYSFADNTQTEVARQTIEYDDQVNVHRTIRDCLYEGDEVIARTIQQPTCVDARIEDGEIVVEVEFEIVVEVSVDEKYVVGSLVVGYEYIGGVFIDVFAPAHFDAYQREDAEEPRPDVGGIVAPDVAFAQAAPDESDDGGEQGEYEQDGHGDEPLV